MIVRTTGWLPVATVSLSLPPKTARLSTTLSLTTKRESTAVMQGALMRQARVAAAWQARMLCGKQTASGEYSTTNASTAEAVRDGLG